MTISRAEIKEYDAVRLFYHSLIDGLKDSQCLVGWKKDIYPSPSFLMDSISGNELFLCRDDDEIVAAMVLNHRCNEEYKKYRWENETDNSELLVIHALGVHPAHSGKGYAKALVQEAIDIARETGMKAIRLDVLEGNYPAEKLYAGFGFQYKTTLQMFYEDTGWKNFRLYEYRI